jgi:hypothetical protein
MLKHSLPVFLAAILVGKPLSAQMGRAPAFSAVRSSGSARWQPDHHAAHPRAIYLGANPLWADEYFPPYSQTPSVVVVQTQPAPADHSPAKIEEGKPTAPLLIEWQGDRYVRRTEGAAAGPRAAQPDYVDEAKARSTGKQISVPTPPRIEPPPATFVFRDGHREESSDYSIISGVIYARGDYWTSGYWSKQVPLSELDLPSTLKANQQRGVPFRLPSAANEVVTRP